MANVLTGLIPDAYAAVQAVSRELVGFIPAVLRDASVDRLAIGQNIQIPSVPANTAVRDIVPAMALPARADQTFGLLPVTITKSRAVPFSWTSEERYAVDQGPGSLSIRQAQIAQAIRVLVNEIETDLAVAAATGGSRAYGTAGTTPLSSNLSELARLKMILDDNGAPSDRTAIINSLAAATSLTLTQLTNVNQSGTDETLRRGTLLDIFGFALRQSAQVHTPASGTGSGYLINNSGGYTKGARALTVDTGTGTILAGDVVTIGNHKYVVASALASNVVTIAAPGLQEAVADNATVTVNAASTRNVAFSRDAMILAQRLPAVEDGDLAAERETVTDPVSGLSFEFSVYPGYRMVTCEVACSWGVKVLQPEHIGVLLG